MTPLESHEVERLREVFWSLSENARPTESCPGPERIWAAAHGGLGTRAIRGIVEHTVACPACAEAWRLARDISEAEVREASPVLEKRSGNRFQLFWRWQFLAPAAASVLVIVALVVQVGRTPPPEASLYRDTGGPAIRSLVPEAEALPRESCRLKWSAGPQGALYDVRVATVDLTIVSQARGLASEEYLVPESALSRLPAGARLVWQVEAMLPDGSRLTSPTFVAIIR